MPRSGLRVPQILAQEATPVPGRAPGADPALFGRLATAGLATAAEGLSDAAEQIGKLEQRKRAIAATHQAARLLTQFAVGLEDLHRELARDPDPERHAELFEGRASELRRRLLASATDPDVAQYVAQHSEPIYREHLIRARREGDRLFVDDKNASRLLTTRELLNLAASSDDPTEQQRYLGQAAGLIRADIQGGILSREAGAKELVTLQANFEEERALRWARRDPLAAAEALERGEGFQALPGDRRLRMAEAFRQRWETEQRRREAEEERARRAIERAMKEQAEQFEHMLLGKLERGDPDAAAFLRDIAPFLTPERREHYQKLLREEALSGGPGDPRVVRQFDRETYSATLQTAGSVLDRLTRAYEAGLVPRAAYLGMASHLQSLKLRRQVEEADKFLARRHQAVKDRIRQTLKTTGTISLDFDGETEDLIARAQEDLERNSAYLGRGTEDPLDWWERNKIRYLAQQEERAQTRIAGLRRELAAQGFPDLRSLNARRGEFRDPADFWDRVRMFEEIHLLEQELGRLRGLRGGSSPAGGTAAPPAPRAGAPPPPPARFGR